MSNKSFTHIVIDGEEMSIIEGNKLIAEFMGVKRNPVLYGSTRIRINVPGVGTRFEDEGLKYHSSWDWLMPVIEKISKMPLQEWDGKPCTDFIDTSYPITFNMPDEEGNVMFRFKGFSLHAGKSLIELAWKAVIEVIEFKNQHS